MWCDNSLLPFLAGDNFCDAMDELVSCFSKQGADIIGSWSADGYDHMESKSIGGDGKFVGALCCHSECPLSM